MVASSPIGASAPAFCQRGLAELRAGRPSAAEALFAAALRLDGGHFESLWMLAIVLVQTGRPGEAMPLVDRAIAKRPDVAGPHTLRGAALAALGRPAEALAGHDRAVALAPDDFAAHYNRGVALAALGRGEEAIASFDRAAALNPAAPEPHYNRATILHDLKRLEAALASYDRAIALAPGLAEPHYNRGLALGALGRHQDALASYDRAIALQPGHAEAHSNRGCALRALKRPREAIASHRRALSLRPDDAETHYNLGIGLAEAGLPAEAIASYDRAIALEADHAKAYNNRALALVELGRHEDALAGYDRAVALEPDYAEAFSNRGALFARLGRPADALASLDRAIALKPDLAGAHYNRGKVLESALDLEGALAAFERALALNPKDGNTVLARGVVLLTMGRWAAGWPDYEARAVHGGGWPRPGAPRRWSGDPDIAGKTLFVPHEQGFGDTLQFMRYLGLAAARGSDVVASVQAPLLDLTRRLYPRVRVLGEDARPDDFDYVCPLLSLPGAFGTTLACVPPPTPWVAADIGRRARFAARLGPKVRPRVGLAWCGNPRQSNDHNRSMAFETIAPLLTPDVEWVALAPEIKPSDAAAFAASSAASFHGEALATFDDTAALVELMDLVITTDTSIAHLAGAMGKPVWVLLCFAPDWRWLTDRADSPWYPSARLFRQRRPGDWAGVIAEARRHLASAFGPAAQGG